MSSDPQPLAAKVSARLCHDLVNPLGAIANGIELLELSGLADGPELELIRASVDEATSRLKFLRLAFGPGQHDHGIGRDEVLEAIQARYSASATSVAWESVPDLTRAEAKAVFLALMALESVTARGGQVMVQKRGPVWTLTARSPKPLYDDDSWAMLDTLSVVEDPPASQIHFTALRSHMSPENRRVEVTKTDEGMVVILTL